MNKNVFVEHMELIGYLTAAAYLVKVNKNRFFDSVFVFLDKTLANKRFYCISNRSP